ARFVIRIEPLLPRQKQGHQGCYWALAKQFHPDVNAGDKEAEGWTKEINRAYEILGNPDARAAYDLELARQRTKARRSFLGGAAAGTATVILTVGSHLASVETARVADRECQERNVGCKSARTRARHSTVRARRKGR